MSGHGYGPYTRGCRCDVCRQAKADYSRTRRADARQKAQALTASSSGARGSGGNAFAPGASRHIAYIDRHGTRYGYEEAGCRCRECTTARTSSDRHYRDGAAR